MTKFAMVRSAAMGLGLSLALAACGGGLAHRSSVNRAGFAGGPNS